METEHLERLNKKRLLLLVAQWYIYNPVATAIDDNNYKHNGIVADRWQACGHALHPSLAVQTKFILSARHVVCENFNQ